MSVDVSTLLKEVTSIVNNTAPQPEYKIECKILANGQWITPLRVDYYFKNRDYSLNYADECMLKVMLEYGVYALDIVPYRDNLQLDLTITPVNPNSGGVIFDKPRTVKRYRVLLADQSNPSLTSKYAAVQSKEAMNRLGIVPVTLQLIEEVAYRYRMVSYGQTFWDTTTMDALLFCYSKLSEQVSGNLNEKILGINISEGYNKKKLKHIIIPDGTSAKDIPKYLHEQQGGIYGAGIGRYLQDQYWYVYPLYETTSYLKNKKSLTIVNVPSDRYGSGEKTYKIDDQHVTILVTGQNSIQDKGLFNNVGTGNGYRFLDASKLMTTMGVVKDNKLLIDRASNMYEIATDVLQSGFNNVKWPEIRGTSNPFKYYSVMAKQNGQALTVEWLHGDSNLLYPAMPVSYLSLENNVVKAYHGVLLGVTEHRTIGNPGATADVHPSVVKLAVFINRFEGTSP